jgi:hypothetical protein
MRAARGARPIALALALSIGLTATALAAQSTSLQAALTPERLGQGTTIEFGVHISTQTNTAPSPLTGVTLSYPANLGIATSGLGLQTCTPTTLETAGAEGCPADSRMGYGSAIAEVPGGPEIEEETVATSIFMAPLQNNRIALLLYADGQTPVSAQIVLPALLLPAPAPFGGALTITVPLIPSWPGGPDVSVISLHATIGPLHLTYYEHIHGKTIPYHPKGIVLPISCPRGGFPFAATFNFLDGSHTNAHTTVPCPTRNNNITPHQAVSTDEVHRPASSQSQTPSSSEPTSSSLTPSAGAGTEAPGS